MRALAVDRDGILQIAQVPEPTVGPGEVLVETTSVGICATDREMIRSKSIFTVPEAESLLILGHEGLGRVVEVGEGLDGLAPGDAVVPVAYINDHLHEIAPAVKVACRIDMCPFGLERRRGINAHGFFRDRFTDVPHQLVRAPAEVADVAMLLEPLTVTLKGLREAHALRQRWLDTGDVFEPEDFRQRTLIIGAGPIGMLGIALSTVYGWDTVGVDVVPDGSPKARTVVDVGADYVNAREASPADVREAHGEFDIIVEAVQDPSVVFDYLDLLAMNGVVVLVGWTAERRSRSIDMAWFVRELLTKHGAIVATVGAGRPHYEEGMRRLAQMRRRFGPALDRMVTARYPVEDFREGFEAAGPDEIKTVLDFSR